jgi:peptidoglycan hydrolase-like protein with peptidoglycan-binding domain
MKFKIAVMSVIPAFLPAALAAKAHVNGSLALHSGLVLTVSKTSSKTAHKKGRSASAKRRPAGPSYQLHPTPERYKEIQHALADKGYYKGEVNGQWGDDSTEALKRFQTDQKLVNDGKISSLSLIQLGLGPKHDGSAVIPAGTGDAAPPSIPSVTEAPPESPISQ